MWLARYAGFHRPDSHISSGGLGTMGYGLPAAMGAALGRPDKESWAIVGDGGLQMTSQEFMTAVADDIPVKVALLDNGKLGMIRQWQEIDLRRQLPLVAPARSRLGEAGRGLRRCPASGRARPRRSIPPSARRRPSTARRWSGSRPRRRQNVLPMMPAGKGLSDLIETWERGGGE